MVPAPFRACVARHRPPVRGGVLRHVRRLSLTAALIAAALAAPVSAVPPTEHQVKAAFLYNFANFVEWPPDALGPAGAPIKVCVVGVDPFGGALDDAFRGQSVQGRRAEIVRGPSLTALGRCHILFLSQSEQRRWLELVKEVQGSPTLTGGDGPPLARQGGMVNFIVEAKRVRFEINKTAAEQAGLRISSKLLSLARLVGA
jgi:hypothetical protein